MHAHALLLGLLVGLSVMLAPAANAAPSDLDSAFGLGGKAMGSFDERVGVNDAALQDDGRIVVVGSRGGFDELEFMVSRYDAEGSLDTTFSTDGTLTTSFGGDGESATAVAVQDDGKIVVAGISCAELAACQVAVSRYDVDGALDTGFADDGRDTTAMPAGPGIGIDEVSIALQADGKVLLAAGAPGSQCSPCNENFRILRYTADGSLDPAFGDEGIQTIDLDDGDGDSTDHATAVAVRDDGKIVVAGQRFAQSTGCGFVGCSEPDFAVARLNGDGTLDSTFSGDGWTTTDFGGIDDVPTDLAVQGDDRIVVVGGTSFDAGGDFAIARYQADGSADSGFSGDGRHTTDFGGEPDFAQAVALQPDGRIVVTGEGAANGGLGGGWDFGIARYAVDGSPDQGFAPSGKATTDFGGTYDIPAAAAVADDGKIVVAGDSCGPDACDVALARYVGGEGVPDTTPPETSIGSGPPGATGDTTPTFEFSSSEAGSSFECRVDGGAFAACVSPHKTASLSLGSHLFEVRASDPSGNVDPSPAALAFEVQAATGQPSTGGDGAPAPGTAQGSAGGAPLVAAAPGANLDCQRARALRTRSARRARVAKNELAARRRAARMGGLRPAAVERRKLAVRRSRTLAAKRQAELRKATRRTKQVCA